MSRAVAPWLLAFALALLLAGCGGGGGGDGSSPFSEQQESGREEPGGAPTGAPTPAPPSDTDQLIDLLSARADALETGAREDLAVTAIGAQQGRDRVALSGVRELRLRDLVYSVDDVEFDTGSAATIEARLSYEVPNVPGSFTQSRELRAGRNDAGHWAIRVDRPDGREHLPWEVAPLAVRRGVHFVIAHPRSVDLGALPEQLERGYDTMAEALPVKLAQRYFVVVGADPTQVTKLTSGILGLDTLAAVADSDVREEGAAKVVETVVSQRLVLVWSNFAGLDPAAQERLVTHELTHLALAEETSGRTPAWMVEGAALLVSQDRRIFEPAAPSLRDLSRPRAMARLTGALQADAYARASAVAFHIANRYGREAFFRLYESFNDPDLAGSSAAELADAATRRILGTTMASVEAAAAAAQAGGPGGAAPPAEPIGTPEPAPTP